MPYYVYVLRSQATGRFYVGSTEDAGRRLGQHNRGRVASTRGRGPWEMVYSEEHPTRWEATRRERCLKAAKSRRLLLELVEGPGG